MPRTGSTLVATLLAQNPDIYTEGNSALCQLVWDMHTSCNGESLEPLLANRKVETVTRTLLEALPSLYYKGVDTKYIFDKGKNWHSVENRELFREFIGKTNKMIVLVRPVTEVVKSLVNLQVRSGLDEQVYNEFSHPHSASVMKPFLSTLYALSANSEDTLFIHYNGLVNNTGAVIDSIYKFLGMDKFKHTYSSLEQKTLEDDTVYNMPDMHTVRSEISVNRYDVKLRSDVEAMCSEMDKQLADCLMQNIGMKL